MIMIVNERGTLRQTKNGGSVIRWNAGFGRKKEETADKLQVFIDNTVVRHMDAYVPFRTGVLKKSVILGSRMGSGVLKYIAPYSFRRYYLAGQQHIRGQRGSKWFHRMWAARKETIIREVKGFARRMMR